MAEQQTGSTPGLYSLQLWCRLCLPEGERDCKPSPGCPVLERSPLGSGVPEGAPRGGWQGTAALSQQAAGAQLRVPPVPLPSPSAELSRGLQRLLPGQGRGERAPEPGEGALVHTLRNRQGNFQNQIQKTSLGILQTMFGAIFILFFSAFWSCAFGRPGEAAVACRCLQCCVMSPGAAFQNRKDAEFSPEQKSGVNALTY